MSGSPRPTSEAFSIHPYTYLHDLTRGRRQLEVRRPLDSEACHSGVCPFFSLRYSSLINYLFLMSHTPLDRNIKVISSSLSLSNARQIGVYYLEQLQHTHTYCIKLFSSLLA